MTIINQSGQFAHITDAELCKAHSHASAMRLFNLHFINFSNILDKRTDCVSNNFDVNEKFISFA